MLLCGSEAPTVKPYKLVLNDKSCHDETNRRIRNKNISKSTKIPMAKEINKLEGIRITFRETEIALNCKVT